MSFEIVSARRVKEKFPDGTTGNLVALVFRDEENFAVKRVKVSSCAAAVSSDLKKESWYLILRSAREAVRDFAYKKYGDKWRDHVEFGRFFRADLSNEERSIIDTAVKLLCDSVH